MLKFKNPSGLFKEPKAVFFRVRDTYKRVTNVYMNNAMIERALYCQLGFEFNNLIQCLQSEIDFEVEYLSMITDPVEQLAIQTKITELVREREVAYNEQIEISKKITNLDIELTYKREVINMGIMLRSMVNIKNRDITKNYNIIIVNKVEQYKTPTNYHPDIELGGTPNDFKVNGKYYLLVDVNTTTARVDEILSIYKTVDYEVVPFSMFMTAMKEEMGLSVKKVMISLDALIYKQAKLVENVETVKTLVAIDPSLNNISEITKMAHNVTSATQISTTSPESVKFTTGVESKKAILSSIAINANVTMEDPVSFVNELNVLITKVTEVQNISTSTLPKKDYFTNYFSASDIYNIKANKFTRLSNYPSWIIKMISDATFNLEELTRLSRSSVPKIVGLKSDTVYNLPEKVGITNKPVSIINFKSNLILELPENVKYVPTTKPKIITVKESPILEFTEQMKVTFYHPVIVKNMESPIIDIPEFNNVIDRTLPFPLTTVNKESVPVSISQSLNIVNELRELTVCTNSEPISILNNSELLGRERLNSLMKDFTPVSLSFNSIIKGDAVQEDTDPWISNQISNYIMDGADFISFTTNQNLQIATQYFPSVQDIGEFIKITTVQDIQISTQGDIAVIDFNDFAVVNTTQVEQIATQYDVGVREIGEFIKLSTTQDLQIATQYYDANPLDLLEYSVLSPYNEYIVTQYDSVIPDLQDEVSVHQTIPLGYINLNISNGELVYNKVVADDYRAVIYGDDHKYYTIYEENGKLFTNETTDKPQGMIDFKDTVTSKLYRLIFVSGYLDIKEVA